MAAALAQRKRTRGDSYGCRKGGLLSLPEPAPIKLTQVIINLYIIIILSIYSPNTLFFRSSGYSGRASAGFRPERRVPAHQNRPRPGSCSLVVHDGARPLPRLIDCSPLAPSSPIQPPPAFRIADCQAPFADAHPPMAGFSCAAAGCQAALITTRYFIPFRHVLVRHHPTHYCLHPAPAPAGAHAAGATRAAGGRRGSRLGGHLYALYPARHSTVTVAIGATKTARLETPGGPFFMHSPLNIFRLQRNFPNPL